MSRSRIGRLALLASASLFALVACQGPAAHAQDIETKVFSFDLPKQPLRKALLGFSSVTGLDVVADGTVTQTARDVSVSGSMTPAQALHLMLQGTGASFRFTNATTVSIYAASEDAALRANAQATELPEITVEGTQANPNSTMTPPPEYAGGQVATGGQVGLLGNRGVMDTPFNQTSYTAKLMQDQNARTLDDVVLNDPSARKNSSPGNGIEDFQLRGFEVSGRDFLFNGLPGVAPTNGTAMMTESLERVEVLKGPNALLNGMALSTAAGGAINLIPKHAGDVPLAQFTTDYGTKSQLGGHVDIGRRFGLNNEFGARFNGVYRDGKTGIDNQSREQGLTALGLDYRGASVRAAADIGYQLDDLDGVRRGLRVSAGVPIPSAPSNTTNFNNPFEYQRTAVAYGTIKGEVDILPDVTAFATIGGSHTKQDFTTANLTMNNANGNIAATTVRNQVYLWDGISGNGGLRGTFDTGPINHRATVAYAHTWREWKIHQGALVSLQSSNLYNLRYSTTAPAPADSALARKNQDLNFSSYVAADTMSVLDERIQLTLGARYQKADLQRFSLTTGATTAVYEKSAVTPMVAILVKPLPNVSLYANYIEALQEGGSAPTSAANAGEALPPFVAKQYEIGAKWDLGRFTATISAFQITQPSADTNPVTNIYDVSGEQRNRGVELNVFGELTPGIRVLGGVSYIDAVLTQTTDGTNVGNRPQGVSANHVALGAEWDVPFLRGLTLTGRVTHDSSNYLDVANTQKVPGWTRLDAGARYTVERVNGKPIVVRATVNNLLDSDYWVNSGSQLGLSEPLTFKLSSTFTY